MADVVIFGAGDIARLAHYYFTEDSPHRVAGFAVDAKYRQGDTFLDLPIVDFEDVERRFPPDRFSMFVALSYAKMNRAREAKYGEAKARGYSLLSYVSSRCSMLTKHPIGDNCFILEDNTVQPFVQLGSDITLWSGNHIGHDVVIEDHCFITSHVVISGHVHVGHHSFIGVNATLRNSIRIAPATLIGAGSVMMKSTIEEGVYMPQRAELFKKKSSEIEL